MRRGLVCRRSSLGFLRLVEQKQSGVVFALKEVKALIAWLLDGFPVIEGGSLTELLDPIRFHVDVNASDVHRRPETQ